MNDSKNKRTQIFESAPIPKAVMTLAVPTIITQLINVIYNYADTWYVGQTGNAAAVAAMSVAMPVFVIMAAIANLFGVGGASLISRLLGEKRPEKARNAFAFCFFGGMAMAAVYILVIVFFRRPLIYLVGGDDNSFPYVYDYMFYTMILGAVPTLGSMLCGHLVRSVGAAKEAGIGMGLGGVLNILLDPLFMFVILPKGQEVTGAAIATMLSNTVSFAYFIIYLLRHRENPVFTLNPKDFSMKDRIPAEVFFIGFPAALQTTLAMVSNIFANVFVRSYGTEAVSGMGVAKKINMLAFNTTMGLTMGILPLIGYNIGAKNAKRVRQTVRFTFAVALGFGLVCLGLFIGFAEPLVRFFVKEEKSIEFGARFMRVIAFAAPLCTVTYLINTVFQAAGQRYKSLLLSVMRKGIVDVPLMALFSLTLGMGEMGVVIATPVAEIISAVVAVILYIRFAKNLASFEKEAAALPAG